MQTISDNHVDSTSPSVSLNPGTVRRLVVLTAKAELAQAMAQQTQAALLEAVTGAFEDAGVSYKRTDRFAIDWRTNTLVLNPPEDGQ